MYPIVNTSVQKQNISTAQAATFYICCMVFQVYFKISLPLSSPLATSKQSLV